jgi:hypothetical protein
LSWSYSLKQICLFKLTALLEDHPAQLLYRKKFGSASNTSSNFRLTFLLKVVLVYLPLACRGSTNYLPAGAFEKQMIGIHNGR